MKKLYYSFVIVLVGLLALFSISQLSTAQNKSEANTETENQKGLQKTNLFQTRLSNSIFLPPDVIFTHEILDGSGYGPRYYSGQSTNIGAWWQGCESTPMTSGRYDCDRRYNYGTFTLTVAAELSAVHVWIGGFNNWGLPSEPNLKLEVYLGNPTSSTTPTALLATSNPLVVGNSYPTGSDRSFTFASPVTLSSGTPYTFRLLLPSGIRGDLGASGAYALYGVLFTPTVTQFVQQGPKLVGVSGVGTNFQGASVSLSADGNTAIIGDYSGNFGGNHAAWIWTRSGGIWTQQGPNLVGSDAVGTHPLGYAVSISADGNTAIVGGPSDGPCCFPGAAWIWTRSGGVWTQQGPKLVGSGAVTAAQQGTSVSLSADGNTAIVGGPSDNYNGAGATGAAWVWTRSAGVWTQQGPKLVGSGNFPNAGQGRSVSISADGNTAIVNGAWVWTRSAGVWTQQGNMLSGGFSSALSADGNTAIVGYYGDSNLVGAAWIWTRSGGVWTQQGPKLVGSGAVGNAQQGTSVSLSPDRSTAIVGGSHDNSAAGAVWIFTAQNTAPAPVVFSMTPSTPVSGASDQDVFVSGTNFQAGLTVDITAPGGGVTTLSGEQIQNVTETSFIMRATLNAPGSWSIKVKNPDNQQSLVFPFTVSSGGPIPFITSINPISPTANGANQNVIVTGGNFQNGLRINATFPSGGITTLQGTGQIQNVTANSFTMRITLNTEGAWKIRVINPDNSQSAQFTFNVQPSGPPPTGLPTSILSPVIGPLRVTVSNQGINDGKWEFNQHKTGNHTAIGGISLSNDTFAWDVNLYTSTNSNADAGKTVFATAAGQVISYVGTQPGGGPGAVLIAHPNAANPVWFSGYLHMTNVRVVLNQVVDSTTVLGDVGRTGAANEHLHFVVYSGQNTRGNLRSFNAAVSLA